MEPKFQKSFIPKESLAGSVTKVRRVGGVVGIMTLLSLVIFIISIALSGGVFLYQQYLQRSIENKKDSIDRARAAFEPSLIRDLSRLDARIESAKEILSTHLAPSTVFSLLEDLTLQNVRFTNFSYEATDGGIGKLKLRGIARSFNAIAQQSNLIGASIVVHDPIFSNLGLDDKGNVTFDFTATVDARLLSYKEQISAPGSERDSNEAVETQPTSTPPTTEQP